MRPEKPPSSAVATAVSPEIGVLEWLRPGEHARAERLCRDLRDLGIGRLRTGFSWADWHTPEGEEWYRWLLPLLGRNFDLLPCFTYTPPSLGLDPKSSSPPRNPKDYADFLDHAITLFGEFFEYVELWNEPNNLNDWDWRIDPSWRIFGEMIRGAAYWARRRGKKTVLGGMCPTDPNWLDMLGRRGVLDDIDAVGMHGFEGTWQFDGESWAEQAAKVRSVLERLGKPCRLWITETGYSTWRHDQYNQLQLYLELLDAPVERAYWYSLYDLHPDLCHQDGFHQDERHYHLGLYDAEGKPKLLGRLLAEKGLNGVCRLAAADGAGGRPARAPGQPDPVRVNIVRQGRSRPVLVTGGAGFVGARLARRLLRAGEQVVVFDNLSRPGVEESLDWLRREAGASLGVEIADVRHFYSVREAVQRCKEVFHLAARTSGAEGSDEPSEDAEVNLQGTLNVLEALRAAGRPIPLFFTSTARVYGAIPDLRLREAAKRYVPEDGAPELSGVGTDRPLDLQSPYACSKGAADAFVLEYARSYGIAAAVLRLGSIYGPARPGAVARGWVARLLAAALEGGGRAVLRGSGKQVRDLLYVDDLVGALLAARRHAGGLSARAFNIGGGPSFTLSPLELLDWMEEAAGVSVQVECLESRRGDPRYYVSDITDFSRLTGWQPGVSVRRGLLELWTRLESGSRKDRTEAAGKKEAPA